MSKTAKRLAVGTLLAAVFGYIAGILTAPKSGKETREDIKHAATSSVIEAEKLLKQAHTQLNETLDEAKAVANDLKGKAQVELNEAIDKSKLVKEKAREVLSALHEEGAADDKDLRRAIDDANKAIGHLRKYLKKS